MATWECHASTDLRVAAAVDEWDAQDAANRIFELAGWPDNPQPSLAARAFLVVDSDNTSLKRSYRYPFADVVGGELVACDAGIRDALDRCERSNLPQSIKDTVQTRMHHYLAAQDTTTAPPDTADDLTLLNAHAQATRAEDPNWRCAAARNLPINTTRSWDGPAASSRIFEWAGFDGDTPSSARARRGFLVYDAANPTLRGSYKLPFADIVDGTLTALASGLRAAASRLPQTDAPQSVLDDARDILDGYFEKLDKMKEESANTSTGRAATNRRESEPSHSPNGVGWSREAVTSALTGEHHDLDVGQLATIMRRNDPMDALDAVFAHPAQVSTRQSDATLLSLAQERHAMDPAVFVDRPPFFFGAEISSNRLDAYFTRMHPTTTLRNFAQDAQTGVSFQNSHDIRALGFGRSLTGRYIGPGGNGIASVESDFYTIPGLKLNSISTDDLILGMRSGIIKDVSVGFFGGRFICSICGRDMLRDWDCFHIPGIEYEPSPDDSNLRAPVLATASVEDAHLAEVSAVYDGATPGAAVLKAVREADAGRIKIITARLIEARYRIALPSAHHQFAGADLPRSRAAAADTTRPADQTIATEEHDMAVREGAGQQPATGTAPAQGVPETQAQPPVLPPATTATDAREGDGQEAGELLTAELNVDGVLEPVRAALSVAGVPDGADEVTGITWLVRERERLLPFQSEVATLQQRITTQEGELERLRPLTTEIDQARAQRSELERLRPLADEVMRLRPLTTEVEELRPLRSRVQDLERAAEDGQQYRKDLVADALAEGVRAYGPTFAQETYRPILETASLDVIKRMRDDWRRTADQQFAGGRHTVDGADGDEPGADGQQQRAGRVNTIPDAAYVA